MRHDWRNLSVVRCIIVHASVVRVYASVMNGGVCLGLTLAFSKVGRLAVPPLVWDKMKTCALRFEVPAPMHVRVRNIRQEYRYGHAQNTYIHTTRNHTDADTQACNTVTFALTLRLIRARQTSMRTPPAYIKQIHCHSRASVHTARMRATQLCSILHSTSSFPYTVTRWWMRGAR